MSTQIALGYPRLRELYAMLEGIPENLVDLNEWRNGGRMDRTLLARSCGTTACAVGWACAYPIFKAEGLLFKNKNPAFKDSTGWSAVQIFFGLDGADAYRLFSRGGLHLPDTLREDEGRHYLSDRQAVRRRIRRFLLREGAIDAPRNAVLAYKEHVAP